MRNVSNQVIREGWARLTPGPKCFHQPLAELSANGSGQTPLAKRTTTYDMSLVHLPSFAHCMPPAQKLPQYPKRAHSEMGGGHKAEAEEGKVSTAL